MWISQQLRPQFWRKKTSPLWVVPTQKKFVTKYVIFYRLDCRSVLKHLLKSYDIFFDVHNSRKRDEGLIYTKQFMSWTCRKLVACDKVVPCKSALKVALNSFQHLYFDGSLWPLLITWCYNHGIKKLPNHWWTHCYHFCDRIGYHSNSITS